jgi:hypothetical protein
MVDCLVYRHTSCERLGSGCDAPARGRGAPCGQDAASPLPEAPGLAPDEAGERERGAYLSGKSPRRNASSTASTAASRNSASVLMRMPLRGRLTVTQPLATRGRTGGRARPCSRPVLQVRHWLLVVSKRCRDCPTPLSLFVPTMMKPATPQRQVSAYVCTNLTARSHTTRALRECCHANAC